MPKKPTDKNARKAADKDIKWMASTMRAIVLLSQPCSYNELPSRSATSKFIMQLTSTTTWISVNIRYIRGDALTCC